MTLRQFGGQIIDCWDKFSFASNLVQRAVQLNQFYGTGESLNWNTADLVSDFDNVVCWDDTACWHRNRVSSRHGNRVNYSGFCGVVFMHDITKENYDLLRIGEQLAVGKNTVFGSGGYKLQSV
ncbi:MAG: hypothetical protein MJY98_08555 [Fibrobacter sp.]|nr:hypothetical protein [Fibrobacter sp.]